MRINMLTHTDSDGVGCAILATIVKKCNAVSNNSMNIINTNLDKQTLERNFAHFMEVCNDYTSNPIGCNLFIITDLCLPQDMIDQIDEFNEIHGDQLCLRDTKGIVYIDHHHPISDAADHDWAIIKSAYENTNVSFPCCATLLFYRWIMDHNMINKSFVSDSTIKMALNAYVSHINAYDTYAFELIHDEYSKPLNSLLYLIGNKEYMDFVINALTEGRDPGDCLFESDYMYVLNHQRDIDNKYIESRIIDTTASTIILNDSKTAYRITVSFAEKCTNEIGNEIAHTTNGIAAIINMASKRISFRSVGEIDVAELATHFGGGGHKNASGGAVTINQIIDIMNGCLYID